MNNDNDNNNNEEQKQKTIRQLGVYMTLPFVLAVPPVLGWLIGSWLDKKLNTAPFLMYLLIVLGFISGFREFFRILKRFGNDS